MRKGRVVVGCYSYLCSHCGKSIREGEKCHLIHVRHGKIQGEAEGTFNGYGSVVENEGFDNAVFDKQNGVKRTNLNSHNEITKSKYEFKDSQYAGSMQAKLYQGKPVDIYEYCNMVGVSTNRTQSTSEQFQKALREYDKLEDVLRKTPASGIAAYHKKCYDISAKDGKIEPRLSESDPDQGQGTPRKEFV